MHDNFGVRLRIKMMAQRDQLGAQLKVIKNLTIEHHPDRFIFVVDWLISTREINNAKPRMGQANRAIHE